MTEVNDMVLQWLKQHSADGLCTEGCGCDGTHPCGDSIPSDCVAAIKVVVQQDYQARHPQTGTVLLWDKDLQPGEWGYAPLLTEEEVDDVREHDRTPQVS